MSWSWIKTGDEYQRVKSDDDPPTEIAEAELMWRDFLHQLHNLGVEIEIEGHDISEAEPRFRSVNAKLR